MASHATIASLPAFPAELETSPIADISSSQLLAGDPQETQRVLEACQTFGFFYLDLSDSPSGRRLLSQAEELYTFAQQTFSSRTPDEARQWHLERGASMFGYKAAGTVKLTDKDRRPDTTEFWNIAKDHLHGIAPSRAYPPEIEAARPLLADFARAAHECGMLVLRALAAALALPRDTFADLNAFGKPAGDHVRLTHKFPRPLADNAIGLPSHTDFGSVTLLFNWLGGLQIQSRRPGRVGEWEWVRPEAGKAIVNLGDAMVKFTNGALKAAKHRVVDAPGEQAALDRYSIVYFVRPCDESLMKPVAGFANGTHVKVGGKVSVGDDDNAVFTAGEWMSRRAVAMGS